MNLVMERRLRQQRSRLLVRSWAYRQRRHAHGAWFRLRRLLADAAAAYLVSPDELRQLLAEGHRLEPVGDEFEPSKVIVFAARDRVARMPGARPVPVRLGGELLAATHLVLIPFAAPDAR